MRVALLFTILALFLVYDAHLFLRGPFLTGEIEKAIAARTGGGCFIANLEISAWKEVTARHVHVSLASGERIFVPELRAGVAWDGGPIRVVEVDLFSPVVLLGGGKRRPGEGGEAVSFPLERLTVREARVVIESRYARAVGPLDAVLAQVGGGKLRLQGSVALEPLPLPVRVDLVFDPTDVKGAAGSAVLRDLQLNSLGFGLPFAGSIDIDLSLQGEGDRQVLAADGRLRDFTYGSFAAGAVYEGPFRLRAGFDRDGRLDGEGNIGLTAPSSGERHALEFALVLGAGMKTVDKGELQFASTLFGDWRASGTAYAGREGHGFDLRADFRKVDLAALRSYPLLPGMAHQPLTGGELSGDVSLRRASGEGTVSEGRLTVASPALAAGHPLARWLPPEATGEFSIRIDDSGKTLELDRVTTDIAGGLPLSLKGKIAAEADGSRLDIIAALPWLSAGRLAGLLEERGVVENLPANLDGEAMASLHIRGDAHNPHWEGEILLRDGAVTGGSFALRDLAAAAAFAGSGASLRFESLQGRAGSVRAKAGRASLGARDVAFSLADVELLPQSSSGGRADVRVSAAFLEAALPGRESLEHENLSFFMAAALDGGEGVFSWQDFELQGLPGARVAGRGTLRWQAPPVADTAWEISFEKEAFDLVARLLPPEHPPPVLEGSGTLSLGASLASPAPGGREVLVRADLTVKDGGVHAADGAAAVGGMALKGRAEADLAFPSGTGTWSGEIRTERFEAFAGPYYIDFREVPLSAAGSGSIDLAAGDIRPGGITCTLREILSLDWQRVPGERDGIPKERLTLDIVDGRRAYELLIRENFAETSPFLAGIRGDFTARLTADLKRSGGSLDMRGTLEAEVAAAVHRDGSFALDGGRISLPFDLAVPGGGARKPVVAADGFGALVLEGLRIGPVRLGSVKAAPAVQEGDLRFDGPVSLPLFGGTVVLHEPRWNEIAMPGRSLSLIADVGVLDVGMLFEALGLPSVQGTVSGGFDRLLLRQGILEGDGRLDVSLFGGTLRFTEFSGRNLSGPVPSWGFSVEASDVDLEQLTETFDFGRISGVAEGYARDVVIAAGQLQHFNAGFGTVRRRGIEQKISVEALEKISILGSGGRPDVFSRGVMSFFKEYNYAEIGFTATLRNDHLQLNGIGGDGERTYLVKGGILPPKANVISHSREISFGEIVERLARIGRVGKESSE